MRKIKGLSSTHIILLGFLVIILAGSFLLVLPISSANGKSVAYIDALFTSVTATCVTGLVTVPTVHTWSVFGKIVILVLIQIGGLGVITVVAGFMLLLSKKLNMSDRMIIQDSFNLNSLSGTVRFIKKVIKGCFLVEGIGALAYMTVFVPEFGWPGIWISLFNSVSAFCNAGIDIIADDSLCAYALNPVVNFTTMILIFAGGIGFVVWWDVIRVFKEKKYRHLKFLSLHSKLALSTTFVLIVFGALMFFAFEYNNPLTMKDCTFFERIEMSLFQSVTTRTAGFATIPQENLTLPSSIVSLVLMFIGGSPVGTAGGVKTVTVLVLMCTALSALKNSKTVDLFDRRICENAIRKAVAVCVISGTLAVVSALLVSLSSDGELLDILYETVSATATVGLTRNFTSTLNNFGKVVIIFTMFFGRVGPISLVMAFTSQDHEGEVIKNPVEEIYVG